MTELTKQDKEVLDKILPNNLLLIPAKQQKKDA